MWLSWGEETETQSDNAKIKNLHPNPFMFETLFVLNNYRLSLIGIILKCSAANGRLQDLI